jgi:hypothetical protein
VLGAAKTATISLEVTGVVESSITLATINLQLKGEEKNKKLAMGKSFHLTGASLWVLRSSSQ